MAVSRFSNLAEYTPFDPYVPTEADMYGKVREVGYNDLLAKKQLDDASHAKLGEVGSLLNQFRPSETFNTYLQDKTAVVNRNRLHDDYQNLVGDLANRQEALIQKHSDNLSTPEAQKDFSDYQSQVARTIGQLKSIKESDDTLKKSQDELSKQLAEGDVGNIDGSLAQANKDFLSHYGTNSQMGNLYNKNAITGTKIIDNAKKIKDYIGDNMTFIRKDDVLGKLGINTVDDILPVLQDSKTSYETKQRLGEHLQLLADNYVTENQAAVSNHAKQIMYDQSILNPDKPISSQDAYKQAEQQVRDRFNQFIIDDRKIGRDLNTKLLSDTQAKASGKGAFDLMNGLTPLEFGTMDNKNASFKDFKLEGDKLVPTYKNLVSFGGKTFINPEEALNEMTKGKTYSPQTLESIKNSLNSIYAGSGVIGFKNQATGANIASIGTLLDQNEEGIKHKDFPKAIEAQTQGIDLNSTSAIKQRISRDPNFKQLLIDQGVNLSNPNGFDVKKAIKNDKEATDKLVKVATNGWAGENLNSKALNQKLDDLTTSSTLRLGKKETLDKNLKELLNTKDYSVDGNSFKEVLNSDGKVENRTDGIIVGSGQNNTSVSLKRTAIVRDSKGNVVKEVPYIQDLSIPSINRNPAYKALNRLNELVTSGKPVYDEFGGGVDLGNGYKAQLNKTYNPNTKEYEISGDVFDPTLGREIPWDIFSRQITKQAVGEVIKNTSILGGKESENQQGALLNEE